MAHPDLVRDRGADAQRAADGDRIWIFAPAVYAEWAGVLARPELDNVAIHEHADPRRAFERHTAGRGSAPDGAKFDVRTIASPDARTDPDFRRRTERRQPSPVDVTRAERDAAVRTWRTDQRGCWWGSSAAWSRADAPRRGTVIRTGTGDEHVSPASGQHKRH